MFLKCYWILLEVSWPSTEHVIDPSLIWLNRLMTPVLIQALPQLQKVGNVGTNKPYNKVDSHILFILAE